MSDQPSLRRRFQFRLRTLMIAVTLLAVACGVVIDRIRLIRERDEAREAQDRAELIEATAGKWPALDPPAMPK
jgi:hypothetical protein